MDLRRIVGSAVVLLAVSALSSCGTDYATNRPYTQARGANEISAGVDVLGAVIVSSEDGSGTFMASLANNSLDDPAVFDSLAGADPNALAAGSFEPITVPGGELVNLANGGGPKVTGEFVAGEFVEVVVGFAGGESAALSVPVVPDSGDFAGLDSPAEVQPEEEPAETP